MAARANKNRQSKGKKNRKFGRNERYAQQRAADGRDRLNARRRIARHLRRYPNDHAAEVRLGQL